jgi:hypothetical protein
MGGGGYALQLCAVSETEIIVTTQRQKLAARKNIKKAANVAKRKRTIAHLPKKTRTAIGKEATTAAAAMGKNYCRD